MLYRDYIGTLFSSLLTTSKIKQFLKDKAVARILIIHTVGAIFAPATHRTPGGPWTLDPEALLTSKL